jgi:hypothetical protein
MRTHLKVLLCIPLMLAGCKSTGPTTTALAPGYLNPADQQMGEVLAGARSFYVSVQQQSAAGQMTLTAPQKTAFNAFGVSLNAADSVYLAYHSGSATQAQAQTAVNQVQQQQAALPLPGGSQ